MAEQLSLNDILSDKEPVAPEPAKEPIKEPAAKEPAAAPKTEETPKDEPKVERPQSRRKAWADKEQDAQGRIRDPETGQYAAKPAAEAPPAEPAKPEPAKAEPAKPIAAPQQEFTEKEKAFQKAMLEERGKRQEIERRLAAIEAAKPAATTEPAKTFWDDPEGALAKHQAEARKESINTRLQMAEMFARKSHPDFDEKIEVFGKILQQTPGLHAQWISAPDPAEFAYNLGKNHMELEQAGSIEEMRAKIERETSARVRAEVEAELKAKADALAKERAALPPSLSEARSTGVNKPVWGGPPSLDEILKG
jgi:hypothetical protein